MYIKSIVIDGFKSYGRRTEINGFDPEFNAITGLNGSGKSNILDAICFVLGLQNLTQVRATLLQDLVYKLGQTGVTKASVTITFDNNNKNQSPVGYESYNEIMVTRQVVMGGKNKYLINGVNAPNNRVKDLFCSVQLNVNNPHFLVMQGRITKVLNMKPMEILAMIEEAAGTRMFESKKQQAEKTLLKKDNKLLEIDQIISEDITPKLNKLKEERGQYLEYKKVERELEHLQKIYIAWKYMSCKEVGQRASENCVKLKETITLKQNEIKDGERLAAEIDIRIKQIEKLMKAENIGRLAELEGELKEKEKHLAKHLGIQKENKNSIQDQKKSIDQLHKSIKDDERVLKSKSKALAEMNNDFQKLTAEEEKDKADLEKARKKYQALSSGLVADDDGEEATLKDQLIKAKGSISSAQTELEQGVALKKRHELDLKRIEAEMKKTETEFQKDGRNMESLQNEITRLEQQLSSLNHDEGRLQQLQNEYRELKQETRQLQGRAETLEAGRLTFRYQDPEPNFDRTAVHGLVCKLIDVRDEQFALAIEKTAGGRLFNVVVNDEVTSKKLLSRGRLERRTTIIPLNKISGRQLDQRTIHVAEKLVGKGNVWPALSLISYNPVLAPAMQYVFGMTFICRDLNIAKKICYHPEIMKRCVTLGGDTCDPSGTLFGGAQQQNEPLLLKIRDLKVVQERLSVKEQRMRAIECEIKNISKNAEKYNSIKQVYDLKMHELEMVNQRLQQTTHYQYKEEVRQLKEKIAEIVLQQSRCKDTITKQTKNIREIEDKMKNAKADIERQIKQVDDEIKSLKEKALQSRDERVKRTDEYDSLCLELEELKKSIENNKSQIEKHEAHIKRLEEEGATLGAEISQYKENVKALQSEVKIVKETITKKVKEISLAAQERDNLTKNALDYDIQIKELEQDLENLQKDSKDSKNKVAEMLREYDWIPQEEQYFGLANGIYDFKENNPQDAAKRISMLQEIKEKLSRNINTKAMNLLTKTEEQYNDLLKKRKQVENDKKTILDVIKDLDEKKKEALKQAWVQVNKDFGSIFSSLLPGAVAKLEPPEGLTVLDGLEFRVGFGGKWKESLGELSGGQRSLVALSLILAMLLFKPAPIYILDEVDAALDLSHTQNIGNMLKTHFKSSQFIVVSLKDGMFNNANVLFRTKFVDGMSTVGRTVQNQSNKH